MIETFLMLNNKQIILIASAGTNVGKTTLSTHLNKIYSNSEIKSFADPLKQCCDIEFNKLYPFSNMTFTQYYSIREFKDKSINSLNSNMKDKVSKFTLREFLIKVSNLNKNRKGPYCFIKDSVDDCIFSNKSFIIFDDFRIPFEYNFLKDTFGKDKVLTIYIDKDGSVKKPSNEYEGLLNNFEFDIKFKYTKDYSNFNQLLDIIKNKLEENYV